MKKLVKIIINIVIFLPRVVLVPLLAIGVWCADEDGVTYIQALKDGWKYSGM